VRAFLIPPKDKGGSGMFNVIARFLLKTQDRLPYGLWRAVSSFVLRFAPTEEKPLAVMVVTLEGDPDFCEVYRVSHWGRAWGMLKVLMRGYTPEHRLRVANRRAGCDVGAEGAHGGRERV
jgi:hypothetical protein